VDESVKQDSQRTRGVGDQSYPPELHLDQRISQELVVGFRFLRTSSAAVTMATYHVVAEVQCPAELSEHNQKTNDLSGGVIRPRALSTRTVFGSKVSQYLLQTSTAYQPDPAQL
jgi:hypothetical protein